jgi:hypothetical protein
VFTQRLELRVLAVKPRLQVRIIIVVDSIDLVF